jgi:hypothetical protein
MIDESCFVSFFPVFPVTQLKKFEPSDWMVVAASDETAFEDSKEQLLMPTSLPCESWPAQKEQVKFTVLTL